MHLPPAASWPVGAASAARALVLALLLLGCAMAALFCLLQPWGPAPLVLLLSLVLSAAWAWWGLSQPPRGQLRWDGRCWHWRSGEGEQAVRHVGWVLDWQRLLLLRIALGGQRPLWLWLQSPQMDGPWLALRRALVAQGPGAEKPADSLPD